MLWASLITVIAFYITFRHSLNVVMWMRSSRVFDVGTHALGCIPDVLPIQPDGIIIVRRFTLPNILIFLLSDLIHTPCFS